MAKTEYLERALLDHVLGGPDYTRPGTVYVGLTNGGVEITAASWIDYARVAMTNNATNWPAAEPNGGLPSYKYNGAAVDFGTASVTGADVAIDGFAIFDAASGDNMLYLGSLTVPVVVTNGRCPVFYQGTLLVTED